MGSPSSRAMAFLERNANRKPIAGRRRPRRAHVEYTNFDSHGKPRSKVMFTFPKDALKVEVDYKNNRGGWVTILSDHSFKVRYSKRDDKIMMIMFGHVNFIIDETDLRDLVNAKKWAKRRAILCQFMQYLKYGVDMRERGRTQNVHA